MKKLFLLIILAVAVGVLMPFGLGFEIESRYRGVLAEFESAGYRLDDHQYERGFFTSKAVSDLSIPYAGMDGQADKLTFRMISDIQHGPFNPAVGWLGELARFQTRFLHEDQPLFPEPLKARVETHLLFSGNGQTVIDMPAFDQPLELDDGITATFFGMDGTIDFNIVNGTLQASLHSDGGALYYGEKGNLAIEKISLISDSARGLEDLMLGNGTFKIERIAFAEPANNTDLDFSGVEIAASTSVEGETINLTAHYAIEKMRAGDMRFEDARLELAFDSFNARAVAQIQQSMRELQQNPGADPQQQGMLVMAEMMKVLPTLLKDDPGFAIKTLQLKTPEGLVQADFSLRSRGMTVVDLNDPMKLISKLEGKAAVQVPELMVRDLLTQNARQELLLGLANNPDTQLTEEQIDELVSMQVDIQINGVIDQQLVERKDGQLVASAGITNGQVSVNDKPFQLPGAAGL